MLTPRHGEVYFERLILRTTACRNLEALKHYNGTTYATYHESAIARGLVVNDNEHELCMQEAVDGLSTPHQLRSLFCMLISNGADARQLYNMFNMFMGQDFHQQRGGAAEAVDLLPAADNDLRLDLENRLQRMGQSLDSYALPLPIDPTTEVTREEHANLEYRQENQDYLNEWLPKLTEEQRIIYDEVM